MFSQMEGLVVDKGITLGDLKGMLDVFVQKIFGEGVTTRLRPSYFPFTEPSVEVDVSCFECGGKGCSLCKGTGWIEILGAGVVTGSVCWKTAALILSSTAALPLVWDWSVLPRSNTVLTTLSCCSIPIYVY